MAANSWGKRLVVTSVGESHGPGVGVTVEGFPAGFAVDWGAVRHQLGRRRPGQSHLTTQRQESDAVEVLSGLYEGRTTGAPIFLWIPNANAKPQDYDHLRQVFRPSHADYTYFRKYGHRDHRGGGRASARVTAGWVAAGALAEQWLQHRYGVQICAWVESVGDVVSSFSPSVYWPTREEVDASPTRCPEPQVAQAMQRLIEEVRKAGDTVGGVIACRAESLPTGWGEPLFDKLHARWGQALLSINAAKGFEVGSGFAGSRMRGSQHNDPFVPATTADALRTRTNHSGGVQGGISTGMPLYGRVAFKPVATLLQPYPHATDAGAEVVVQGKGRHDPCVVPRAVPIVEAMTALTLMDFALLAATG